MTSFKLKATKIVIEGKVLISKMVKTGKCDSYSPGLASKFKKSKGK